MQKIIIATNNKDKVKEITEILKDKFIAVSMKEAGVKLDIEETGNTFEQNAFIKAKACFDVVGLPCIADDSGISVAALGGEPGVYSAEYAINHYKRLGGEKLDKIKKLNHYSNGMSDANVDLLLANMKGQKNRKAKFVCCMVYYDGSKKQVGYGETLGQLLDKREGKNGFGYDPIFFSTDLNKCFAIATASEKNAVSHRKRALDVLLAKLT